MNRDELEKLADARIALALDQFLAEIAPAIGDALRTYGNRPASEQGALALKYGTVTGVGDGYADVTVDGQTTPTAISTISDPAEGDRVGVLFAPPSGAVVLGGGGGGGPGGPGTAISELPDSGSLGGNELFPISQSGATYKISTRDLFRFGSFPIELIENGIDFIIDANPATNTMHAGTTHIASGAFADITWEADANHSESMWQCTWSGGTAYFFSETGDTPSDYARMTFHAEANSRICDIHLDAAHGSGPTSTIIHKAEQFIFRDFLAAPPDLNASEYGFWLDDTPGAAFFMVTAKDSGGTTVTGSLALT